MRTKLISIFTFCYFALGSLVLPMGNFALLPQLPQMYQHCKTHEHPDMDAWEFITDHLVNVDGIFDAHENGDDQKPHVPTLNKNSFHQTSFNIPVVLLVSTPTIVNNFCWQPFIQEYKSSFVAVIFHPPIV